MAEKPNIILIVCDQMRGDCMGAAGHPDVKTPYIDTLAGEGTLFDNAYSSCPSCIPARAALLCGQSQARHGRVGYQDGIPWDFTNMLPSVLSQNGYHTEAVGKMHVHPPLRRCGFNGLRLHDGYIGYYRDPGLPGWQQQTAHDAYLRFLKNKHGQSADVNDTGVGCNSWVARPWCYDEASHPTNWVVEQSIDFLQMRDRDMPFMLMASFVRPHPPFDAPECYFDFYRGAGLAKKPAKGSWQMWDENTPPPPARHDSYRGTQDEALQAEAMRGYYANITHMDHQIGRLMDALEAEKLMDNSIIIFVSDHGELLFDHGLYRKALPYQGSIKIPLAVRVGQNLRKEKQAAHSGNVAELRDIAPTILQLAGLAAPKEMDGKSLVPALYGEEKHPREYLHGEHTRGEFSNHFIVTENDKYIWFSQTGREQYFNLKEDPEETKDAIANPANKERTGQLRQMLINELSSREECFVQNGTLAAGRPVKNILSKPL